MRFNSKNKDVRKICIAVEISQAETSQNSQYTLAVTLKLLAAYSLGPFCCSPDTSENLPVPVLRVRTK